MRSRALALARSATEVLRMTAAARERPGRPEKPRRPGRPEARATTWNWEARNQGYHGRQGSQGGQ
eukprot:7367336-Pyramimonas_sp.AAC.1